MWSLFNFRFLEYFFSSAAVGISQGPSSLWTLVSFSPLTPLFFLCKNYYSLSSYHLPPVLSLLPRPWSCNMGKNKDGWPHQRPLLKTSFSFNADGKPNTPDDWWCLTVCFWDDGHESQDWKVFGFFYFTFFLEIASIGAFELRVGKPMVLAEGLSCHIGCSNSHRP